MGKLPTNDDQKMETIRGGPDAIFGANFKHALYGQLGDKWNRLQTQKRLS